MLATRRLSLSSAMVRYRDVRLLALADDEDVSHAGGESVAVGVLQSGKFEKNLNQGVKAIFWKACATLNLQTRITQQIKGCYLYDVPM